MAEWLRTIDHKDCGYPGNKETERKRVSSGKKVGIILALSLAKFNNCFLYLILFVLIECYLDKWGDDHWQWHPGFPWSDQGKEAERMHLGPCCQILVFQGGYLAQKRSKSITDFFFPSWHSLVFLEFVFWLCGFQKILSPLCSYK